MDRLTYEMKDGGYRVDMEDISLDEVTEYHYCYGGKAIDKLAEYENLEQQRKLIKLPCSVKDTVYLIEGNLRGFEIVKCIIDEFSISADKNNTCYAVLSRANICALGYRFKAVPIENFGKSIFLTRKEAETKLRGHQND